MAYEPTKPRLTAVEREAFTRHVVARYAEGVPIRTIAFEEGWSYGGIHRILVSAGVELRPRGGNHPQKRETGR